MRKKDPRSVKALPDIFFPIFPNDFVSLPPSNGLFNILGVIERGVRFEDIHSRRRCGSGPPGCAWGSRKPAHRG